MGRWQSTKRQKGDEVMKITKVSEIRNMHQGTWFDRGNQRFFHTVIENGGRVSHGKYFITSERFMESDCKRYSVRAYDEAADEVETVSKFQEFLTVEDARDYIKTLKAPVESYADHHNKYARYED
jgi:hypothetical protein